MDWLIVGLGNPGKRYKRTRHNLGAEAVLAFAEKQGWPAKEESRWPATLFTGALEGVSLHCMIPGTYMNLSGQPVGKYVRYYKPKQLLVIADDMAFSLGEMRLLPKGGAGGHNGLKDIALSLGTQDYPRLRLGIGRPAGGEDPAEYVLQNFSTAEEERVRQVIQRAVGVLQSVVTRPLDHVMTEVNSVERGETT